MIKIVSWNIARRQEPWRWLAGMASDLDYAFASRGFHDRVSVRAMNEIDEWGPSDHCRLMIEVKTQADYG